MELASILNSFSNSVFCSTGERLTLRQCVAKAARDLGTKDVDPFDAAILAMRYFNTLKDLGQSYIVNSDNGKAFIPIISKEVEIKASIEQLQVGDFIINHPFNPDNKLAGHVYLIFHLLKEKNLVFAAKIGAQ